MNPHDVPDDLEAAGIAAEDLDRFAEAVAAVPVRHISLALPPGSGEADYRAAYAALAEQEAYWALFPERLTESSGPAASTA